MLHKTMAASGVALLVWACADLSTESTLADRSFQTTTEIADVTVSAGQSIQAGIDAAPDGGTVVVEAGRFVEDLTIFKSLRLISESGPEMTAIVGVGLLPATEFPRALPNIDIQANDVSISGFTIESPAVLDDEYASGIVLSGTDIDIYGNEFVVATGANSLAIQTWFLENARVGFRDISGLTIRDNTFRHLAPPPAGGPNLYEAVFINPQEDPVDPANPVVIERNAFSGLLIRAVATDRRHVLIQDNVLSTASGSIPPPFPMGFPMGLRIGALNVSVLRNVISSFEQGIRVLADLTSNADVAAHYNSISGNGAGIVFQGLANGFTVDATSNWWGDASGPSGCSSCTGLGK